MIISFAKPIKRLIKRLYPERQLFYRSRGKIRFSFITLSPGLQIAATLMMLGISGWVVHETEVLEVMAYKTTIAIKERTNEIGLLRALGAKQSQVLSLFLGEAIVLAAIGGVSGLVLGIGIAQLLHLALPALPVHTPMLFVLLAEAIAVLIGLLAGVLPARRAALLDPVEALRSE